MTEQAAQLAGAPLGSGAPGPVPQAPTRPTWSPVEEARKKVDLAIAAAAATGGGATAAPMVGTMHHTTTPRLMVIAAMVASVPSVFSIRLLSFLDQARAVGGTIEFTPLGRLLFIGFVGGSIGMYFGGWVWWTAAAGANARRKNAKTGSAAFAPVAHAAVFGLMAGIAHIATRSNDAEMLIVLFLLVAVWTATNLGILLVFRSKAAAIKAETNPWSRLLWLPVLIWVMSSIVGRYGVQRDATAVLAGGGAVLVALAVWYLVSLAIAMKSFDEACRTPSFARGDGEVPDFMRMALAGR
jgi:hypothetical protein